MIRKKYRKIAILMLAAAVMCAPVCRAQEKAGVLQSADDDGGSDEQDPPETDPPETNPPETNPPETNPPETNPPETNPPETNPPETNPPETNPPETNPPETNPPETSAPAANVTDSDVQEIVSDTETYPADASENHSTAIPENPTEKKLDQKIVDAGEVDEGFSISINGGESVVIEPDKGFRDIVNAITAGNYRYAMDYIRPTTRLREPIEDIESEGTIKKIFDKVRYMPGSSCDIVLYLNEGRTLWMNMRVQGSLDTEDAAIVFTSAPEEKAYTVTYDANGGSLSGCSSSVRRKGEWYSHFDGKAEKDGEYFCGWFDGPGEDAVRVFPTDPVEEDTTLYAHFSPYGKAVAVFDFGFSTAGDGGNLVHHLLFPMQEGGTYRITATPKMERNGLVIAGWKDAYGERVDPTELTGLTESRTFTAIWEEPSETASEEAEEPAEKETEAEPEA